MMLLILQFILAAFVCWGINFFLVRNASCLKLVDIPNQRSSHSMPTPRGGGLGIVLGFSSATIALWCLQPTSLLIWAILLLSWIIAAIGLYDDLISSSAMLRLCFQIVSVVLLLLCIKSLAPLPLGELKPHFQWLIVGILLLAAVWLINLYNFMDGIDGLAALEAIYVLAIALFTLWWQHIASLITPLMLSLLGTCLAFLWWNRPKAKIFMGDVGSGFLGFMLAIFAIFTISQSQLSFISWLIWLAVFWVDASYTLCVRLFTKQAWFSAHRSHAYQILARRWQSHARVDIAVLLYNLCWLTPLSIISIKYVAVSWLCLLLAVAPIMITCIKVKAGRVND